MSESQRLSTVMPPRTHWKLDYFGFALLHDIAPCLTRSIGTLFIRGFLIVLQRLMIDYVFLRAEERVNIDTFIEKKMQQASEGNLVSYYSIDELVNL